jgi:serine/threonine protein phosphatase PrpC
MDKISPPVLGEAKAPLEDGSLIVLCSDGFWEYFAPEYLVAFEPGWKTANLAVSTAKEAVRRAAEQADNTTLLVLRQQKGLFPGASAPRRLWKSMKNRFTRLHRKKHSIIMLDLLPKRLQHDTKFRTQGA